MIEEGGTLTLQQAALRALFTDGLALGGKAFVDGAERNRRLFGPKAANSAQDTDPPSGRAAYDPRAPGRAGSGPFDFGTCLLA